MMRPRRRRLPGQPPILIAAVLASALLLGTAWWEKRPPASVEGAAPQAVMTVEIPGEQRAHIRSWEAFFTCYDLIEEDEIISLTLKRAYRGGQGTLAFPTDGRIEVELPQGGPINISSDAVHTEVDRVKRAIHSQRTELQRQCSEP